MNYEEIVLHLKELRAKHERTEAEFFLGMMHVEAQKMDVLRQNGCTAFDQFIRTHDLCQVDRYRMFTLGVNAKGEPWALLHGAHATMHQGRLTAKPDAAKRHAEFVEAFVEVHKVAPSEQASKEASIRAQRELAEPQVVRAKSEIERLREENAGLKRRIVALEKERDDLVDKVRKLQGAKRSRAETHDAAE